MKRADEFPGFPEMFIERGCLFLCLWIEEDHYIELRPRWSYAWIRS